MSILYINTGSSANAGDGDSLRTAFTKINSNFQFIDSAGVGSGSGGYTGSQGEYGYTGSQGYEGSRGYVGSRGAGYTGSASTVPGYTGSAGFVGSSGFVGSQGAVGPTGYVGSASTAAGYAGSQGDPGPIGYVGSQSTEIGYTGSAGLGEQGYTGSQGTVGYAGSRGDLGYTGSVGPEGPQGYSPDVVPGGIYIQLNENPVYTNVGPVYVSTLTQTFVDGQAVRLRANILRSGNTPIAIGVISENGGSGVLLVFDENNILTMYQMGPGSQSPISQQYDLSGVIFGINRYLTMEWQCTPDSVNGSVFFGSVLGVGSVEMQQVDPFFLNLADTVTNGPFYLCAFSAGGRQDIADVAYELGIGIGGANGYTGSAGAGYTGSASTAIGYTGSAGTDGYIGSIGYTGSTGFIGSASTVQGPAGPQGFDGSVGFTGSRGAGYTGSAGVIGYTGSRGFIGSQGYFGSQGPIGFIGSFGYTGSQGDQGIQGDPGQDGPIGYTGSAGYGFTGSAGAGYTGSRSTLPGYTGSAGFTGSAGAGFTGSQGAAGVGLTGDRGYAGSVGYTGSAGTGSVNLSAVAQDIIPALDSHYNLGSSTRQWKSLYVSTNTIYINNVPLTIDTATNTLQIGGTPSTTATNLATENFVIDLIATIPAGPKGSTNQLTSGTAVVSLAADGTLTVPGGITSYSNTGTSLQIYIATGFETNFVSIPATITADPVGADTTTLIVSGKNGVTINAGQDAHASAPGVDWTFGTDGSLTLPISTNNNGVIQVGPPTTITIAGADADVPSLNGTYTLFVGTNPPTWYKDNNGDSHQYIIYSNGWGAFNSDYTDAAPIYIATGPLQSPPAQWGPDVANNLGSAYPTVSYTYKQFNFGSGGNLTFPQGTTLGYSDPGGFIIDGAVDKDIAIYTYSGANAHGWTFGPDGYLTMESLYLQGYLKGVDGSTGTTGQVLTRQSNGGVAWADSTGGGGAPDGGLADNTAGLTITTYFLATDLNNYDNSGSVTFNIRDAGATTAGIIIKGLTVNHTQTITSDTYAQGDNTVAWGSGSIDYQLWEQMVSITAYAVDSRGYTFYAVVTDMWDVPHGPCLVEGTQVTMSDGTHKAIEDIAHGELIRVWNFDLGEFSEAQPLWIKVAEETTGYDVYTFNDGTKLRTVGHHVFNKEAGAFTKLKYAETPVGTTTFNERGEEVTLLSKERVTAPTRYYNVWTQYHLNLFADGILTSNRFNNIYPIVDMKFVKDNRVLRDLEEFTGIDEKYITGLRLQEQSQEYTAEYISNYVHNRLERLDIANTVEQGN